MTSPSITDTRNGSVTVTVNANGGDLDKVKKVQFRIISGVSSTNWGDIDYTVDALSVTQSHTFNINNYVNSTIHDVEVQIRCTNDVPTSKTSSVVSINLKGDDVAPSVAITSPLDGATGLNGNWSILGSVSDDWSGVDYLYYGYFNSMTDGDMNSTYNSKSALDTASINYPTAPVNGKWLRVPFSTPSWTYTFDTTKIPDGAFKLYVAAGDKVGKISYTSKSVTIDQNADKPTAAILVPVCDDAVTMRLYIIRYCDR